MPIVSIEIAKNLQGNEEDMMIAVAIATTMLVASFLILFCINFIQFWMNRRYMETN